MGLTAMSSVFRCLSAGRNFAERIGMATRKTLDRRPGPLPDIQMDGDSVTFRFSFTDPNDADLVVRCDERGDVYLSIANGARRQTNPFGSAH